MSRHLARLWVILAVAIIVSPLHPCIIIATAYPDSPRFRESLATFIESQASQFVAGTHLPEPTNHAINLPHLSIRRLLQAPRKVDSVTISVGGFQSCGLQKDRTAWCFGTCVTQPCLLTEIPNGFQEQDGTRTGFNSVPVAMAPGLTWESISAGSLHVCGLTINRTISCWGNNQLGQLARSNGSPTISASMEPAPVIAGGVFSKVLAGGMHTCAIRDDGVMLCWGNNAFGQLGDGTTTSPPIPVPVTGGYTFQDMCLGYLYTCGVSSSGNILCWGNGSILSEEGASFPNPWPSPSNAPVDVGAGGGWSKVTCGDGFLCGIRGDGILQCWGANQCGQLGINSTETYSNNPSAVAGGGKWIAVEAAQDYCNVCGIQDDGKLLCWGGNDVGQNGQGTTASTIVPTEISGGGIWTDVSVRYSTTCAIEATNISDDGLDSDGIAQCWGTNEYGMLGDGTTTTRNVPTDVSGEYNWLVKDIFRIIDPKPAAPASAPAPGPAPAPSTSTIPIGAIIGGLLGGYFLLKALAAAWLIYWWKTRRPWDRQEEVLPGKELDGLHGRKKEGITGGENGDAEGLVEEDHIKESPEAVTIKMADLKHKEHNGQDTNIEHPPNVLNGEHTNGDGIPTPDVEQGVGGVGGGVGAGIMAAGAGVAAAVGAALAPIIAPGSSGNTARQPDPPVKSPTAELNAAEAARAAAAGRAGTAILAAQTSGTTGPGEPPFNMSDYVIPPVGNWDGGFSPMSPTSPVSPSGSASGPNPDSLPLMGTFTMDDITLIRLLGDGACGRVWLAKWQDLEVTVRFLVDYQMPPYVREDTSLAHRLALNMVRIGFRHSNVTSYLGFCVDPPAIAMEYSSRGSLGEVLKEAGSDTSLAAELTWEKRLEMAIDASKGLLHLHTQYPSVFHGHLKSTNLLVSEDWQVKIADANLRQLVHGSTATSTPRFLGANEEATDADDVKGSEDPRWTAPEVLRGQKPDAVSDIYALGIILWELLTWRRPWGDRAPEEVMRMATLGGRLPIPGINSLPGIPRKTAENLGWYMELIQRCTSQEPLNRPGLSEILLKLRSKHKQSGLKPSWRYAYTPKWYG